MTFYQKSKFKLLGNGEIIAENWVSSILNGSYSSIAVYHEAIAAIPSLDDVELFKEDVERISSFFSINSRGLIKNNLNVKSFAKGECPDFFYFLEDLLQRVRDISEEIIISQEMNQLKLLSEFQARLENSTSMEQFVKEVDDSYIPDPKDLIFRETYKNLPETILRLQDLMRLFGKGYDEYKFEALEENSSSLQKQLPLFSKLMFELPLTLDIGLKVGNIVKNISEIISKSPITPVVEDALNLGIIALKSPEKYYKMVNSGKAIQRLTGKFFSDNFEGYSFEFANSLLQSFHKMTYQQQINFKKAFGIFSENSNLINLCSYYINRGYRDLGDK